MKHVFDNEEGLLSDLMGDPQESLIVQQYIADFLDGSTQVRTGVREQLRQLGTKAFPGMMQSILSRWARVPGGNKLSLSENHAARELLKDLICGCCKNNSCAREFIVRSGIQKNPFKDSRAWLISVFSDIVGGKVSQKERDMIDNPDDAVRSTSESLTEFIPLVFKYDHDKAFTMATHSIQVCLKTRSCEELTNALCLLQVFQNDSGAIIGELITKLFSHLPMGTNYQRTLESKPITFTKLSITPAFVALNDLLPPRGRNKYVDWFFVSSVCHTINQCDALLADMEKDIRGRSKLVRYWFRAVLGHHQYKCPCVQKLYDSVNLSEAPADYLKQLFIQYILGAENMWHTGIDRSWVKSLIEPLRTSHMQMFIEAEEVARRIHEIHPDSEDAPPPIRIRHGVT